MSKTELVAERRNEIVAACEKLYQTMSFKDITIIEIGKVTPFKRTSIYNYFHTKEEIFLLLLQKEYEIWIEDLEKIIAENKKLTKENFADLIAKSLENRLQLLKLLSMNLFDMEMNSRQENLIEFKKVYGKSLATVKKCLDKFFPKMSEESKNNFLYAFFPFVYGIYPYTVVNEKQISAMKAANTNFIFHSVYELTFNFVEKFL